MRDSASNNKMSQYERLCAFFKKINLFDEKEDLSFLDQLLSTRIFLLSLVISLSIIIIFTAVSLQTETVTISSPSENIFNQLSIQYPTTLSCPCKQTSIRQDEFLSFNPQYHPICTSQIVNQTFISSYLSDKNISDYWPLDYRIMIASHFQILALFCQTIQQTVSDAIDKFATGYIISNQVLFRNVFYAQIEALVEQLKTTTIANYKHMADFLWLSIGQNGIYSGLRTNYFIQNVLGYTTIRFFSISYTSLNISCSCKQSSSCVHEAGIYNWTGRTDVNVSTSFGDLNTDPPLLFSLSGLMVGCLPYNSLLKSTLQCFYNQSCIDLLQTFINGLSLISPLSSSHFLENTTVDNLLDKLFIESWNEESNYTNYFQVCSPSSCIYTYERRFNLLYTIVTLISLFGGLRIITYFFAPWIVKIIRRIQKIKFYGNKTDEPITTIEQNLTQSLKNRPIFVIHGIYQQIVTFNLFPWFSDIKNGIHSTRLYILSFSTGILILIFYASISIRVRSSTVYQPSLNQYKILFDQYPSTLICPCSQLSIPHSTIMNIVPYYHQVCSSDFIKYNAWLLYTHGLEGGVYSLDFRSVGMQLFTLLQTFCRMSNETVTNELTVFYGTQFVTAQVLTNDIFSAQTSTLIKQFQNKTIASFLGLFQLVRIAIQLNQFFVSGSTTASLSPTLTYDIMSWRFISANTYDNNCSCGTSSSCTTSQGFYCRTTSCFLPRSKPNYTIPGLLLSCLSTDSLLESSLQCFYSNSCLQMVIQWQSFDSSNMTIDPRVANVTSLDPTINSRFSPDTTLDKIVSQLFIENWTDSSNFSAYYNHCAPDECTYTYEERFNIAYLISTILGIAGGLSTALRIFIPPIVKLIRRIYHHCCHNQYRIDREAFVKTNAELSNRNRNKLLDMIKQIRQSIQTMNLYRKKPNSQTSEELQIINDLSLIKHQQIATRFYIILFFFAIIIILLFTGLSIQTHSVTVSSPTESEFEFLQARYSSTISCPCSQIAISYSKFLSIEVSAYHQVCSSYFISSDFINLVWSSETKIVYFWHMDTKILSSQFRLLSSFCSLAKDIINQSIDTFSLQELITVETLTRSSFQLQIDSIINNFIIQTPADFRRTLKYIIDMLHANQLQNIFNTNWNVTISDPKNNYIMSTYPIQYNETGNVCSCATSSTCLRSIFAKGNLRGTISGMIIGCLPMYGLRSSTLECLYNSTCLTELAGFISTYNVFDPLNISVDTRFTPISSTSFGTLIDELFIETWKNTSNYMNYFSTCAPLTCRYSYIERNNAIYMLTTFLGLYGGLTIGLKFIIWRILSIYWKICQWFINRRGRVEAINEKQ